MRAHIAYLRNSSDVSQVAAALALCEPTWLTGQLYRLASNVKYLSILRSGLFILLVDAFGPSVQLQ